MVLVVLVTIVAVVGGVIYFGPASLGGVEPLQNARVFDVDNTLITELRPEQNRVVVSIKEIPKLVQNAFIAVEDERFWSHPGVDPIAIARAVVANARGDREGASTITQQYVKNTVVGAKRSWGRKIREAITAVRIDRRYSKEQILAGYLNSIYLGNGAYGVQAASRLYFGHDIQKATLEQAALLAGITASPTAFDPRRNQKRAEQRRNHVLQRMQELGMITVDQRTAAAILPAYVNPPVKIAVRTPGFVDWVRGQLKKQVGEDRLYRGGLKVKTTIDLQIQTEAETAVAEILNEPGDPEAAVVVVDVATGGVRAMVGGRNKKLGDLNLATQGRRQAGSAFKPFVLATALEQGMTLETRYSAPGSIRLRLPSGEVWRVPNYDRRGRGRVTLARGLALSINTVFAQLIRDVDPENVASLATEAGIRSSRLRPLHSLALGTSEVSPLDMATAYATLAREGEYLSATGLARVEDAGGRLLLSTESPGDRKGGPAVDPTAANETIEGMKGVVKNGTGRPAKLDGYTTWGKTGTTDDYADAWFCGGAGGTVACVWVGYPQGRVPMKNVHGIKVVGSSFPARIWKRVMTALLEKYRPVDDLLFAPPRRDPRPSKRPSVVTSENPTDEPSEEPTEEPTEEPDPLPIPTLFGRTPAPRSRSG